MSKGLRVSLNQSSPPYAALEAELLDPNPVGAEPSESVALEAGRESFEAQALRIRAEAEREARMWMDEGRRMADAVLAQERDSVRVQRKLDAMIRGMTARLREAEDVAQLVARAQTDFETGHRETQGLSAPAVESNRPSSTTAAFEAERRDVSEPSSRVRLKDAGIGPAQALAAIFAPVIATGGPDLVEHFAVAAGASSSEAALAALTVARLQKERPVAGTVAALGAPPSSRGGRAPTRAPSSAKDDVRPLASNSDFASLVSASLLTAGPVDAMSLGDVAKGEDAEAAAQPQIVVSGEIEMAGGLALSSQHDRIAVFHEVNGEMLESGAVSLKEGRYEILIASRRGFVVAELRTPSGEAIGRGAAEVASLGPASRRFRYDQVNLKMVPVVSGLSGKLASFSAALGVDPEALRGAAVEAEGLDLNAVTRADGGFLVREAYEGSSIIARASKNGFWKALAFVAGGLEAGFALPANKAVAALLQAFSPSEQEPVARSRAGVVWGRVLKDGRPVAGATVDVATGPEGSRAIYFDESMRPDPGLKQTSSNGAYAFYPLLPGVQLAQASLEGETSETVVFPSEPGSSVKADIDVAFNRKVDVAVFDAFRTSVGLQARVASFGRENVIETDAEGSGHARFSGSDGLAFVEVDAGPEYATARLSASRDRKALLAPMVSQAWIDRTAARARASVAPKSGVVVGFVQGHRPYRAGIAGASAQVIYFDSVGRPLDADFGTPGGGFLILNAPEGLRTLAVEPAQSEKRAFQTVLVEPRVVNVASFWLR